MNASATQVGFAAEFILFVVAVSGAAMVLLRPGLLSPGGRARLAALVGFVLVATAALVHGSLIRADGGDWLVAVPRLVGLVLVAAAIGRQGARSRPTLLVAGSIVVVALAQVVDVLVDEPATAADALRVLGAVALGAALLEVSRRSIPARVAAGAAATVLLVVLAVSVALSTVVVRDVENQTLDRTEARAIAEAKAIQSRADTQLVTATSVARLLRDNAGVRALLITLVDQPDSAAARRAAATLQRVLAALGDQVLSLQGLLDFVTTRNDAVPGTGQTSNSELAQLPFLGAVSDPLQTHGSAAGPELVGRELLAVAAAPVAFDTDAGPRFAGVVVVAERLNRTYLRDQSGDDPDLSLALVDRDGVLSSAGSQPSPASLRSLARRAADNGTIQRRTVGGRFVVARPLRGGVAVVASAPERLAAETRQSLFRTLFLVALAATLLAIMLAAALGSRIGRGLRRLTATADEIERGNLDVHTGLERPDELGALGDAFDRMAISLRTVSDELREAAIDEARLRGRLEAVVGGMVEALVAVDAAGVVTDFNQAAADLFAVPPSRVLGRPVASLQMVGPAGENLADRLASPTEGSWATEGTVLRPDGTTVPVSVSGGVLRGPIGESAGAVAILHDVRAEREVEQMKTDFLANISHEMRTPLTPIKGYAQMLASRDIDAERAKGFAQQILAGAGQLERVINQLVNFATIAAGRLEPAPEAVPIRAVLDDAVARWNGRLDDGHPISRRVARGTPDLCVDRRLIDLSLDELLDNAVKYSPDGGAVSITAGRDDNGSVLVSIADHGVGVEPSQLETIFADFAQGDGSSTRAFGGLGLGLPLVRHVARAHGGDLVVESTPGRGSTFTLRLPAVEDGQ
ncbi:MAG: HAMP domain-containing protein [Acidobacteria bacterium]|nr:HAMP domain-containing protein [Acidobacteriota bacterium]